ncbi:MAG: nicotinic acid mononucleotide adenylyltransferase, partial [Methylococcales bacterium]|nr:nicotinic acid mononucleotide adenylyltransferase [Methylococcales bacterium]
LSSRMVDNSERLMQEKAGSLFFQAVTQLDISATAVRDLIKAGMNPAYLLPDNVIEYIDKNKLYK